MVALLAIGGVGFYSAYNEAQEIYDTELSHVSELMLSLLLAEDKEEAKHGNIDNDETKIAGDIIELGNDFEETGQRQDRNLAFRIWKDENLLFYSRKAGDFGAERTTAGFANENITGHEWRFYVLRSGGYTIEIAQKIKVRAALITKMLTTIFSPLIMLLPVIMVLTWGGMRVGLKPLLTLSEAVKKRSALDLKPLPPQALTEINPLVNSINNLLANLDYALEKERRFTDFAAHELRTPVAVFKTLAQTAIKSGNDEERRMILDAQVQAADRATNMVDQLLTLARIEHSDIPLDKLRLDEIVQAVMQEIQPLAANKNVSLALEKNSFPYVRANRELLTAIFSNLIGNAIKYTPDNGNVTVTISSDNKTAAISICDSGPGIPEDKLPSVTEKFFRLAGHKQPGAGLGLAIVKRAIEISGAQMILRNRQQGGLEALVKFNMA